MLRAWINNYNKHLLGIAVGCAVTAFIGDWLFHVTSDYLLTRISCVIVFIIAMASKEGNKKLALKKKGLTPGDLRNIEFVKNWEVTRKTGLTKYCVVEGGLVTGIILFIPISVVAFFIVGLETILSNYRNLLAVSSVSLTIAYFIGVVIYYIRWQTNERRFMNLTDPLRLLS